MIIHKILCSVLTTWIFNNIQYVYKLILKDLKIHLVYKLVSRQCRLKIFNIKNGLPAIKSVMLL